MRRSLEHNFTADLFGGVQAGPGGGPAWAFSGVTSCIAAHRPFGHGWGLTPDAAGGDTVDAVVSATSLTTARLLCTADRLLGACLGSDPGPG
jgi:hypothetical protein